MCPPHAFKTCTPKGPFRALCPHLALPSCTCSGSPFMLLDVDAVHAPAAKSLTAGMHLFLLHTPPLLLRDHHERRGMRAPCLRAGVPLWGAHLAGGGWGARIEASAESWRFTLQRGPAAKSLALIPLGIGNLNCGPSDGCEMASRCLNLHFPGGWSRGPSPPGLARFTTLCPLSCQVVWFFSCGFIALDSYILLFTSFSRVWNWF